MTKYFRFLILVLAQVCLVAVGPRSALAAGPLVVFTVDAESNEAFRLPEQVDAMCAGGVRCGLMEIVRRLQARGWAGTFFVNAYEHKQLGESAMRDIALQLETAHQEVALHTHPDAAYDPRRPGMYEYSLEEQVGIVRDGVRLLKAWTGRPIVSHRAGAYMADERTLAALAQNGITFDSSLFWKIPASHLDVLGLPRNLPSQHAGITEIPVTVYEREDRPPLLGAVLPAVRVVRKIDPNWLVNEQEMQGAIDAAITAHFPVVVLFLHSFSFMDGRTADGTPAVDHHAVAMFDALADYVAAKGLTVVTMRDLAAPLSRSVSTASDIVPRVVTRVDLAHYTWRQVKAIGRLRIALVTASILLLSILGFVLARRRRDARATPAGHLRERALQTGAPTP